jgi:hypothetical protein
VLFVCPHGAGKSRIAAAWFDALAPEGWTATTAGMQPQASVSVHALRLLADTPALAFLDRELPRPLAAVADPTMVVAIDCPRGELAGAAAWRLMHGEFDPAMAAEIRLRVQELVALLDSATTHRRAGQR